MIHYLFRFLVHFVASTCVYLLANHLHQSQTLIISVCNPDNLLSCPNFPKGASLGCVKELNKEIESFYRNYHTPQGPLQSYEKRREMVAFVHVLTTAFAGKLPTNYSQDCLDQFNNCIHSCCHIKSARLDGAK